MLDKQILNTNRDLKRMCHTIEFIRLAGNSLRSKSLTFTMFAIMCTCRNIYYQSVLHVLEILNHLSNRWIRGLSDRSLTYARRWTLMGGMPLPLMSHRVIIGCPKTRTRTLDSERGNDPLSHKMHGASFVSGVSSLTDLTDRKNGII